MQAQQNIRKAQAILELYEKTKREIHSINSTFSLPVLDSLFYMPIFNSADFIRYSVIPKHSALRLLKVLVEKKIIECIEHGKGRTPGIYLFPELLNIAD
jgi:hypothetical protein